MDLTGAVVLLCGGAMIALLLTGIIRGWFSGGSSLGFLTGMHDLQPRDRQEAIEVIVEQKAGKEWSEQTTGQGEKDAEGGTPPEGETKR